MEINWRTIEKDGIPPVGTFCLCKLEGGYSSCGYMILLVSSVAGNRLFTLYDLLVPPFCPWTNGEIEKPAYGTCDGCYCDEALDNFIEENGQYFDDLED